MPFSELSISPLIATVELPSPAEFRDQLGSQFVSEVQPLFLLFAGVCIAAFVIRGIAG